jgi:hypothetical protein
VAVAGSTTTVSVGAGVVVVVVVVRSMVESTEPSGTVVVSPWAGSSSGDCGSSSLGAAVSGPITGTSAMKPAAAATVTPIRARPAGYVRRRPKRCVPARTTGSTRRSGSDASIGAGSSTAEPVGGSRIAVGWATADSGRRARSAASRVSRLWSFTTTPFHARVH